MYTLFSTQGCHLCDDAEALLRAARAWCGEQGLPPLDWEVTDIADDDALFERYGWLIPVLRRDDGAELRWPFDPESLVAFITRA
jgi:hypothetical protein